MIAARSLNKIPLRANLFPGLSGKNPQGSFRSVLVQFILVWLNLWTPFPGSEMPVGRWLATSPDGCNHVVFSGTAITWHKRDARLDDHCFCRRGCSNPGRANRHSVRLHLSSSDWQRLLSRCLGCANFGSSRFFALAESAAMLSVPGAKPGLTGFGSWASPPLWFVLFDFGLEPFRLRC